MTTLIRHRGAIVAVAGPSRYYLAPALARLPVGDRERQLVVLKCEFAHAVASGRVPAPYSDARAEQYAALVQELLF